MSIKETSQLYGKIAEYIAEHTSKTPRAESYRGTHRTRVSGLSIAEEELTTADTTAVTL